MLARDDHSTLKTTPLHELHAACGGKMVPFAGYEMPVQYPTGMLSEHLHTRAAAGLFDVSHMGQIALRPRSGRLENAARRWNSWCRATSLGLAPGRQRYAQFTDDPRRHSRRFDGRPISAAMLASWWSTPRARTEDEAHLRAGHLRQLHRRAPRRPRAAGAAGAEGGMRSWRSSARMFRRCASWMSGPRRVDGIDCVVSRSGYTGEDGFEISVPAGRAERLARTAAGERRREADRTRRARPLRLEAGLCLYGHDIDDTDQPGRGRARLVDRQAAATAARAPAVFPAPTRSCSELAEGRAAQARRHQARGPRAGARGRGLFADARQPNRSAP